MTLKMDRCTKGHRVPMELVLQMIKASIDDTTTAQTMIAYSGLCRAVRDVIMPLVWAARSDYLAVRRAMDLIFAGTERELWVSVNDSDVAARRPVLRPGKTVLRQGPSYSLPWHDYHKAYLLPGISASLEAYQAESKLHRGLRMKTAVDFPKICIYSLDRKESTVFTVSILRPMRWLKEDFACVTKQIRELYIPSHWGVDATLVDACFDLIMLLASKWVRDPITPSAL